MTSPFIPIYRQFPTDDPRGLERQLVNFHNQISVAVNNKTIGTFDTNSVPNGERWFPASGSNSLRDGNRLVVQVSDGTSLTVAHGITLINQMTRLYGTFFDGTNWWPLPYVDLTNVNNQINVEVTSTQIVVTKGAGSPPTISKGIVVLEWV